MSRSAPPLSVTPLASVLNDIERCIKERLYYPGLLVALTVPEICSALSLDRSEFVKQAHYVNFVECYTVENDLGVSAIDCYRLRGGVVHRANMVGHPNLDATHMIFTVPETRRTIHCLTIVAEATNRKAAMVDLPTFCRTMIRAAENWYEDHKADAKVRTNIPNLIRFCPDGVFPFFKGIPVVASGED